jgi:hypothetical protein
MTPTATNKALAGGQSRSLSAAYELVQIGQDRAGSNVSNSGGGGGGLRDLLAAAAAVAAAASTGGGATPKIAVLKGGFYEWRKSGRPVEVGGEPGSAAEAAVAAEAE